MALILSGDAGITFPVTAGSASAVQASSTRVLQVVQATYSTQSTVTSTTYADTGLSASITPSSATSKILVMGTMPMRRQAGSVWGAGLRIVRNSTAVSTVMSNILYSNTGSTDLSVVTPFNYVDSPATTSATTYKIQFNSGNASATISTQTDNDTSVIILMEIAA